MILKVFVPGTWKIGIFIYQDEKTLGEEQDGGEGDVKLVFLAKLRRI